MKIAITMDESGHFSASNLEERQKTIDLLKTVNEGFLWEDNFERNLYNCDLSTYDLFDCQLNRFIQFIEHFETRGMFEIVEI